MNEGNDSLKNYVSDSLKLLKRAAVVLPKKAKACIYHHHGIDNIYQVGAMFINVVDRDYCKSIVVMQKDQHYPEHYHKIKTESMYVHYGELVVVVDKIEHRLLPGEIIHIERGQDHSFYTVTGTVFEEISTMYIANDSVYQDEAIRKALYSFRRTVINEIKWEEIIRNAEGESILA